MCGIAAIFQARPGLRAGHLKAMTDIISHRGPDGEGFALADGHGAVDYLGGEAGAVAEARQAADMTLPYLPSALLRPDQDGWTWGLGHRRLAIVDLTPSGHQPMSSAGGRYLITYNGEVYNHLELRAELEQAGHSFRSHSDTEVILAAYAQWGEGCLNRFNGMFAFVIIDRQESRIFAARDRFGVKPLYIMRSPGHVAFASEIKQFTVLPGWRAEMNWQAAHDFMAAGITDHGDTTLFQHVKQVPGGHLLACRMEDLPNAEVRRWYDVQPARHVPASIEESAQVFSELFSDAVRLRLRADVPVGTALSGGLDSSSVVCEVDAQLASASVGGTQKSFSVCSTMARYDERRYIDVVTQATKVQPHYAYPDTQTLLDELPSLVWHQDEPFAGTSIFAEWEVYKLARANGVKVTLDGHGADELLCGYHPFFWIRLNELLLAGRLGQWQKEFKAICGRHGYTSADVFRSQLVALLPVQWVRPWRNRLRGEAATQQILACPPSQVRMRDDPQERMRPWRNSIRAESLNQLTATSVPVQLHWADRDSMAHSVESRLPFLDYRLVEFIIGNPAQYKIGDGVTKRLLRLGMAHRLPEAIAGRQDKMGFVTPEQVWLCQEQSTWFLNWLDDRQDLARTLLSQASLDRARRILRGQERYNRFAWRVLSMVMWAERFDVQPATVDVAA